MKSRPNTTQRSWSNYQGDNPYKSWATPNTTQRSWNNYQGGNAIKSWAQQGFYDDPEFNYDSSADAYRTPQSADRSPLSADNSIENKESAYDRLQRLTREAKQRPQEPSKWMLQQRKSSDSRLQRAMQSLINSPSPVSGYPGILS